MTLWLFATLKAQHLEEVLEIEKASFQHPWKRRVFENELTSKDAVQFAVLSPDSRRVIAYVFVRIVSNAMHLSKIAVAHRWRRSGLATRMLERCFEAGRRRGIAKVALEVRATNRAAIELYLKLGFKKVGTRHRYYTDTGEDALVMVKRLHS